VHCYDGIMGALSKCGRERLEIVLYVRRGRVRVVVGRYGIIQIELYEKKKKKKKKKKNPSPRFFFFFFFALSHELSPLGIIL